MATYAVVADFEGLIAGWVTTDAAALEALLKRAERDIDSYLGIPVTIAGGPRIEPLLLSAGQREALKRATCWQAHYRFLQGEEFFVRDQHESVTGPDFGTRGTLSRISPAAEAELAGTGLSQVWRTVTPPAVVPQII